MKKVRSLIFAARSVLLLQVVLITACSTSQVEIKRASDTYTASGSAMVIFPNRMGGASIDDARFVECLQKAIQKNKPDQRFVPAKTFRDVLFPWFEPNTAPETPDELQIFLARSSVQKRISELNVRHVIVIAGATKNEGSFLRPFACGYTGCLGLTWWGRESNLAAIIWDLKDARVVLDVEAKSAGTAIMPAFILPVPLIPQTEKTVCQDLGQQLAKFLSK